MRQTFSKESKSSPDNYNWLVNEDEIFDIFMFLEKKTNWRKSVSAFFHGGYYLNKYADLTVLQEHPLAHYIKHGFKEGRSASPLIDLKYMAYQLYDLSHPFEVQDWHIHKMVSKYDNVRQILAHNNINPNPLFNNAAFLELNELNELSDSDLLPIEYYFNYQGINPDNRKALEVNYNFSFDEYSKFNKDVFDSKYSLLEHLLNYGLAENRLKRMPNLIEDKFMKGALSLYCTNNYSNTDDIFSLLDPMKLKLGPRWNVLAGNKSNAEKETVDDKLKQKKITFGIVLYENTEDQLSKLTASIEKEASRLSLQNYDLIFWANDANLKKYKQTMPGLKVFGDTDGNIGFGCAHNRLMAIAFEHSDYYFCLNPDGYLLKDALTESLKLSDHCKDQALIELPSFPIEHPKWYDPIYLDTNWISGASFLMPKGIWEQVKGFDENLHMYCEDVDLSWRTKLAGFKLKVCPKAKFFHDVTYRAIDTDNQVLEKKRNKMMYIGAYYLSKKWGDSEMENEMKNVLIYQFDLNSFDLPLVKNTVERETAERVSCFKYGLRFSVSRYWE